MTIKEKMLFINSQLQDSINDWNIINTKYCDLKELYDELCNEYNTLKNNNDTKLNEYKFSIGDTVRIKNSPIVYIKAKIVEFQTKDTYEKEPYKVVIETDSKYRCVHNVLDIEPYLFKYYYGDLVRKVTNETYKIYKIIKTPTIGYPFYTIEHQISEDKYTYDIVEEKEIVLVT